MTSSRSPRRLYLKDLSEGTLTLEGDEAHHAKNVLRAQIGDLFTLFDGEGHELTAAVSQIKKQTLFLEPKTPALLIDRRPHQKISVAIAFPKSRGRSFLTEKLVEIGVRRIIPLITTRSIAPPESARLERESLAACKQCGINFLPEITPPRKFEDLLKQEDATSLILLDPQGKKLTPQNDPLTVVVGPEGGWTAEEIDLFSGTKWCLADQILRSETACLVAAARLTS